MRFVTAARWEGSLANGRGSGSLVLVALSLLVLSVGACSGSTSTSQLKSDGQRELSVRPIIEARPVVCGDGEEPPRALGATGYYQLAIPAEGSGASPLALCVYVGAAALQTSDFSSGVVDEETALAREGAQVGWSVDLTMTGDGRARASALIDGCRQQTPQCPGSLGAGGNVIIVFGDAAISAPIDAGDPTAFANGVLGVFVRSKEEASALADRVNPTVASSRNPEDQSGLFEDLLPVVFFVGGLCVVVVFLWATARNARRYRASFQAPEDLRRAEEYADPTGGSPNGGGIWPSS